MDDVQCKGLVDNIILLGELGVGRKKSSRGLIESTEHPDIFFIELDTLGELFSVVIDGDDLDDELFTEIDERRDQASHQDEVRASLPPMDTLITNPILVRIPSHQLFIT